MQFTNTYDTQGRRITLALPDNSTISYTYQGAYLYQVSRKGQTHTYKHRTLDGLLVQAELPSQLGLFTIARDPLTRWIQTESPYFQSKMSYDAVGNLLTYQFHDSLGTVENHYRYDDLNQLIEESDHTYQFDSLHNRLKKDNHDHTINNLNQITHDGKSSFHYDLDGNLTSDGHWNYAYDSQDRLISASNPTTTITFTYDPFHRRLSKTTPKGTLHYLWDGDNEIGCLTPSPQSLPQIHLQYTTPPTEPSLTQLRILGEGLGAEIGAAILLELNNTTYIPLHDHRGCLVTLINTTTTESYRYTAFGEELTPSNLSPWRFSSKRLDPETHLLFFGRRYYSPSLGRWLTQDPAGLAQGPNLYAYVSNNPLTLLDLYGLFETTYRSHLFGFFGVAMDFLGIGRSQDYRHFEDNFSNKSRSFNLNAQGYNFKEPPLGRIYFANGMGNTFNETIQKSLYISNISGLNTYGLYGSNKGFIDDVHEAAMYITRRTITPAVMKCKTDIRDFVTTHPKGEPMLLYCHSRGTGTVDTALSFCTKKEQERVIVAAFCPSVYIDPKNCRQVTHYVHPYDPVTCCDIVGRVMYKDTIVHVPSNPPNRQHPHEFLNPIYQKYVEDEINNYMKLLKRYEN